jgi:hypothetical protein
MAMKRTRPLLAFVALVLVPWSTVVAAPMPPLTVVNHDTKECAQIFGGDECMDCFPPEGWEILGVSSEFECPEGYTLIDTLDYTCQGFKNQFCCSEGHSGAHGSCQDMVVNDKAKQCAFVEDITNCALPKNWDKKPGKMEPTDWFCPATYEWLDTSLSCAAAESTSTETETDRAFCPFAAGIGPAIVGLWLLVKRNR